MRAVAVVVGDPIDLIRQRFLDARIDLARKRDLVELLQDRLVEALADPIGLRISTPDLCTFDTYLLKAELNEI